MERTSKFKRTLFFRKEKLKIRKEKLKNDVVSNLPDRHWNPVSIY